MRLVPLILLAACGGRAPATAPVVVNDPFPPVPPDAAPADAEPEVLPDPPPVEPTEQPVGAMPVPDEASEYDWYDHPPIEALDTTVTDGELPARGGRWKRRTRVHAGGEVWLVFQVDAYGEPPGEIRLGVVHDETGMAQRFALGRSEDRFANPFDGSSLRAWTTDESSRATGPILFSARIKPRGANALHQFVVYVRASSVLVVERPLGGKTWQRRLRLDFDREATFVGLTNSDPH